MIHALTPKNFDDYELLDCGNFLKLERFGKFILIRPEPQAVWDSSLSKADWEKQAHVKFVPKSSSSGDWIRLKTMPEHWNIKYSLHAKSANIELRLKLALTSFKHVGVFPEQAVNWDYISRGIKLLKTSQPKFLNLFAYTGAASIAARSVLPSFTCCTCQPCAAKRAPTSSENARLVFPSIVIRLLS